MEPIPETRLALERLGRYGDSALQDDLTEIAAMVVAVVPGIVGFSLGLVRQGVTFTYVATSETVASLDAVQFIDGGPCVDAVSAGEPVLTDEEHLFDERRWHTFAQASASAGVRSTLSLPVLTGETVTAGINVYGAGTDTFSGREKRLAEIFGAWAPGAVHNADLAFTTRHRATEAPARLEDLETISQAAGILAVQQGISPQEADSKLQRAAERAGVSVVAVARLIVRSRF
jgi:GAF domain-containing protein